MRTNSNIQPNRFLFFLHLVLVLHARHAVGAAAVASHFKTFRRTSHIIMLSKISVRDMLRCSDKKGRTHIFRIRIQGVPRKALHSVIPRLCVIWRKTGAIRAIESKPSIK